MAARGRPRRVGAAFSVDLLRHADRAADVGRRVASVRTGPQRTGGRPGRGAVDRALAAVRLLCPGSPHVHAVDLPGAAGRVRAAAGDGGRRLAAEGRRTADEGRRTKDEGPPKRFVFRHSSFVRQMVVPLRHRFRRPALHPLLRRLPAAGLRGVFRHRLAGCSGAGQALLADAGRFCRWLPEHRAPLSALAAGDAQPVRGGSFLLARRAQDQ